MIYIYIWNKWSWNDKLKEWLVLVEKYEKNFFFKIYRNWLKNFFYEIQVVMIYLSFADVSTVYLDERWNGV